MNVSFNDLHANPQNSQLIACLTGTPEFILDKLKEMVNEIETSVDRRPHQICKLSITYFYRRVQLRLDYGLGFCREGRIAMLSRIDWRQRF